MTPTHPQDRLTIRERPRYSGRDPRHAYRADQRITALWIMCGITITLALYAIVTGLYAKANPPPRPPAPVSTPTAYPSTWAEWGEH